MESIYLEGGHCTHFVDEGNNWGGDTAQHCKKELRCGKVGVVSRLDHNVTLWVHLPKSNLPDPQIC